MKVQLSPAHPVSRIVQIVVLLTACAVVGCSELKPSDIAGTWMMTEASRQHLPVDLQSVAPRLTLGGDGTFSAVVLPGAFHGSVDIIANTGRGTWRILRRDGKNQVQLDFDGGGGSQLGISNVPGSSTTLYYYLGDPDSGQRVEFTMEH